MPLCGHATLAAATALFHLHPNADEIAFETRWRGTLTARLLERGKAARVAISLPLPTELRPATDAEAEEARKALKTSAGVGEVVRVARFEFGTIVEVPVSVDIGALKVDTTTLVSCQCTLQLTPAPDLPRAVHHHPGFWGLGRRRGYQLARLRAWPRHS